MRMMETIRKKGSAWLIGFLGFFLVSVFAGLGISGGFSFRGGQGGPDSAQPVAVRPMLSKQSSAVMTVNGRPVEQARFNTYVQRVLSNARQSMSDPSFTLDIYAFSSTQLIREEVIAQKGEELNITVSSEDIAEAKAFALQPFLAVESGPSGNIIGDLTKGLGSAKNKKVAFKEYLSRNGVTEKEWQTRVRRELQLNNTYTAIQEAADNEALLKAEETKVLVDESLAEGVVFQDVVREYSDDPSAERGGDIGTWVRRGMLSDEIEDALYTIEKGGITDWFEVEVGFQRFKVYSRKETTDPEFADAEAGIIDRLSQGKDEDYVPTDEEIAEDYLEIKYYFIQLNKTDPNAAAILITDLIDNADIAVNDPYVLAHQALNGDKLQPPSDWTMANLEKIAKDSYYGEGYDFSLIADKMAAANPDSAPAEDNSEEASDEASEEDGDAEDGEADGDEEPSSPDIPELLEQPADFPVYALGIGLLNLALGDKGEDSPAETNYLIANVYLDWLDDDEQSDAQPLNRTEAREAVEANLERAVSRYNYTPEVYAKRGLNLAWLDRTDEAKEQLEFADKYAPSTSGGVWDKIREGYEILDDQEAMDSVDARVAEWRQAELQEQIARQQASSMQQQQPITFNLDDLPKADDAETDGEGDDGTGEEANEDTEDSTEDTEE